MDISSAGGGGVDIAADLTHRCDAAFICVKFSTYSNIRTLGSPERWIRVNRLNYLLKLAKFHSNTSSLLIATSNTDDDM